ncbi:MAG: transcription antitermination factor NusB [bacterium]
MRKRTRARTYSLELLYWLEITKEKREDKFFSLYPEKRDNFSLSIVSGVKENEKAIDKIIKSHLENWKIERLALIDHKILQIAIYELLFSKDAPAIVIIDEAIELSKMYSTSSSYKIINGILDKIKTEIKRSD